MRARTQRSRSKSERETRGQKERQTAYCDEDDNYRRDSEMCRSEGRRESFSDEQAALESWNTFFSSRTYTNRPSWARECLRILLQRYTAARTQLYPGARVRRPTWSISRHSRQTNFKGQLAFFQFPTSSSLMPLFSLFARILLTRARACYAKNLVIALRDMCVCAISTSKERARRKKERGITTSPRESRRYREAYIEMINLYSE